MSSFMQRLEDDFRNFPGEFQQEMRRRLIEEPIQAAREEERQHNMLLAAAAMFNAGLTDNVITQQLQKYWGLRLSETTPVLNQVRYGMVPYVNQPESSICE